MIRPLLLPGGRETRETILNARGRTRKEKGIIPGTEGRRRGETRTRAKIKTDIRARR